RARARGPLARPLLGPCASRPRSCVSLHPAVRSGDYRCASRPTAAKMDHRAVEVARSTPKRARTTMTEQSDTEKPQQSASHEDQARRQIEQDAVEDLDVEQEDATTVVGGWNWRKTVVDGEAPPAE